MISSRRLIRRDEVLLNCLIDFLSKLSNELLLVCSKILVQLRKEHRRNVCVLIQLRDVDDERASVFEQIELHEAAQQSAWMLCRVGFLQPNGNLNPCIF